MSKYGKFYNLYQRCISGNIFWKKHIPQNIPLSQVQDYLKQISEDETLYKRKYLKYSDFLTCQTATEAIMQTNDRSAFSLAHDMWGASAYHMITHACRQMQDTKKIFITKERENLFNLTDVASSFTINDINIDQNHTLYLESNPDVLYLIRKELLHNPYDNEEDLYRWCLLTINPKNGTGFISQEIYIEGVEMSVSDLYNCNRTAILQAEKSMFASDDHKDEMIDNANKMIPLVIKTLLYMKATHPKPANQHEEAIRLRTKDMPLKRKEKLLKSAPQFIIHTLDAPAKNPYSTTQTSEASRSLRGHWVRGHFRKQRHGKGFKEMKVIYIEPFFKGDADNMVDQITKI
jgi:hypothetical protein